MISGIVALGSGWCGICHAGRQRTTSDTGHSRARAVALDLGLAQWDARHDSDAFTFTRPFALTAIGNTLAFWNREQLGMALTPGVDEVSLALVADAWSRTYRSRAVTFAGTATLIDPARWRRDQTSS